MNPALHRAERQVQVLGDIAVGSPAMNAISITTRCSSGNSATARLTRSPRSMPRLSRRSSRPGTGAALLPVRSGRVDWLGNLQFEEHVVLREDHRHRKSAIGVDDGIVEHTLDRKDAVLIEEPFHATPPIARRRAIERESVGVLRWRRWRYVVPRRRARRCEPGRRKSRRSIRAAFDTPSSPPNRWAVR